MEVAKLVVKLLSILAWPGVVVGFAWAFRDPVQTILRELVKRLSLATKLSMGSFSLEVQENARHFGGASLAIDVGTLTKEAVEVLLRTPRSGAMRLLTERKFRTDREVAIPADCNIDALIELRDRDLVKFAQPLEPFLRHLRDLPSSTAPLPGNIQWYSMQGASGAIREKDFLGQEYVLTDKGRMAADAIVKAVGAELAR